MPLILTLRKINLARKAERKVSNLQNRKLLHLYCSGEVKVPCELRAPEDFPKRRYNLLDMSAVRVAYYGQDYWLFSL